MASTHADDDDSPLGFMGGVLGKSKKVLFPEADSPPTAAADEAARTKTKPGVGGKKKSKSRGSRRARLAAASNSSLANITTTALSSSTEGGGSGKSSRNSSKLSISTNGKENNNVSTKATSTKSISQSKQQRGHSQKMKMDSLVMSSSSLVECESKSSSVNSTLGNGVIVHRRKSKSSSGSRSSLQSRTKGDCSLSACREETNTKNEKQPMKRSEARGQRMSHEETMPNKSDPNSHQDTDSSQQQVDTSILNVTTYSIAELENSFSNNNNSKGRRRGGRGKATMVSSLVQGEVAESKPNDSSGMMSSLMALPASTQKTQKSTSLAQRKALRRKISSSNSRRLIKEESQRRKQDNETNAASSAPSSHPAAELDNNKKNDVASLTNYVESLNIEGEGGDCSTPLTIRHRAPQGSITSPPNFLHRFSTLSSNNNSSNSLFPNNRTTPREDANPSLKKRFDGKKTPDKVTALDDMASPMAKKMSISPNPYACNNRLDEVVSSPSDMSIAGSSPRILILSSSFMSSPNNNGGNILSEARSNLFSSSKSGEQVEEEEEEETKPASSETKRSSAGSAVIAIESATPRKSPVAVKKEPPAPPRGRGSCVLEVETAAPIIISRKEVGGEMSNCAKKLPTKPKKKKKTKPPTKKTEATKKEPTNPRVAKKEETESNVSGEPPRRSARESKQTDRLTVASWKRKGRKFGDRKVTFDNAAEDDESVDDGVEEEADSITNEETNVPESMQPIPREDNKLTTLALEVSKQQHADKSGTSQPTVEGDSSEAGHWSATELQRLRNAQKDINPTSTQYWQEIANQVGSKSSSECQIKWQSMVATPKVRKAAKKKEAIESKFKALGQVPESKALDTTMPEGDDDGDDEDDLFNSSPYREADDEDGHDVIATKFGNLPGLSPFIKPTKLEQMEEEQSALKFRRKGYNTYIETLRKDINRVEKNKKALMPKIQTTAMNITDCSCQINADSGDGEDKVSGKLLPDGTVSIRMQEDSCDMDDLDDIWGDEVEDEE